jgi:pimeloyl-ACP methyl ester carboxylesterase
MDYLLLGTGPIPLVLIPGAGDGQKTADEARAQLRWYFARRSRQYRILYLSRRQPIPDGFTVEQHADDYLHAVEQLRWQPALWECNSGGGPIGQWVAVKRPDLVRGLVLSCTLHRANEHFREVVGHWKELAQRGEWAALSWESIQYTFRPRTVGRYRLLKPLLRFMSPPRYPERLGQVFAGLLHLDNRPILPRISCPTLVIGGEDDRVIDREIQEEMGRLIPHSRTVLYPGFGHGNDQENPDYERQVARFATEVFAR